MDTNEDNPFALGARAFEGHPGPNIEIETGGRIPNMLAEEPQRLIRAERKRRQHSKD